MNPDGPTIDRLRALPKAEVHVHLEGCFKAPLLERWAHKFGEPIPRPRERLFRFGGPGRIPPLPRLGLRAGAAGLKRTVHAGESSGREGVRDAIGLLGAARIDHGVRAVEDSGLVALLAERQIPPGVCPSSNRVLGVYPSMAAHPIGRLRRAGVAASVNTDDPALFGASIEGEYALCREAFAWSDDDVRAVARTSIDSSFASDDVKARLREGLARW